MKKFLLFLMTFLFLPIQSSALEEPVFTDTGTFEVERIGLFTTYKYEANDWLWQSIVDDPSTSCLLRDPYYSEPTLADHYNQDFAELFLVEVDDIGVITENGTDYYYVCNGIYDGYNNGLDICFIDGTTATDPDYPKCCDLLCYTCNHALGVNRGVLIVTWVRCEKPSIKRKIEPYMLSVNMVQ